MMNKKQISGSPGLVEKASCSMPDPTASKDARSAVSRERVIYFSFFIQSQLSELFTNSKEDKRILKIEITCHCLFRLSGAFTGMPQFNLVEAFLDERFGNFEGCVHMLEAVFKGVGCSFILNRTINMNLQPNGSCDYSYHYNALNRLNPHITDETVPANCLQRELVTSGQSDSIFSSFSVTNSTVSRLFKELESDIPGGWGGDTSIMSRKSLKDFVGREAAVQQLEGLALKNYGFVIEEMFFEALTSEVSSAMWRCRVRRTCADLLETAVQELLTDSCLVTQSVCLLADSILEPETLIDQICTDCLSDNFTVVYNSAANSAHHCANNNSTCCGFDYEIDSKQVVEEEGDSTTDVSESLLDENWSVGRRMPLPPMQQVATREFISMTSFRFEQLFYSWCAFIVEEACVETLVELVSQRLIVAMYKTSRSKSQFECRIVKTFARFGRAFGQLESTTAEPELTDIISGFFACVADTLDDPDARGSFGQTSDLVMAVQESIEMDEAENNGESSRGRQLLKTARTTFQQAVRDQLAKFSTKLQRHGRQRHANKSSGGAGSSYGRRLEVLFDHSSAGDPSSTTVTTGESLLELEAPPQKTGALMAERPQHLCRSLQHCLEAADTDIQEPEEAPAAQFWVDGNVEIRIVSEEINQHMSCTPVLAETSDGSTALSVWKTNVNLNCQARHEELVLDVVLVMTPLEFGHASRISVAPVVDDATVAVVAGFGPAFFVCSSPAVVSDCAVVPYIAAIGLETTQLVEFSPAAIIARTARPRTCLHGPRPASQMAASLCCLRRLDAIAQCLVRAHASPTELANVQCSCSTSTGLLANPTHTGVRPSRSHCYQLGVPDKIGVFLGPPGFSSDRASANSEIACAAVVVQLTSVAPAIGDEAFQQLNGFRSTQVAANRLFDLNWNEPDWQLRRSRSTRLWPAMSERALVIVSDRSAPGGGSEWPKWPVTEWLWARPATGRLHCPTLTFAFEVPSIAAAESTASTPPISLIDCNQPHRIGFFGDPASELCTARSLDCVPTESCFAASLTQADWSSEEARFVKAFAGQPALLLSCFLHCDTCTEHYVIEETLGSKIKDLDSLSVSAHTCSTIVQPATKKPAGVFLSACSSSLLRLAFQRSQSSGCIVTELSDKLDRLLRSL